MEIAYGDLIQLEFAGLHFPKPVGFLFSLDLPRADHVFLASAQITRSTHVGAKNVGIRDVIVVYFQRSASATCTIFRLLFFKTVPAPHFGVIALAGFAHRHESVAPRFALVEVLASRLKGFAAPGAVSDFVWNFAEEHFYAMTSIPSFDKRAITV